MASVSFLARSVARRSVDKLVRLNPPVGAALVGSVRWSSSYFTPGKATTSLLLVLSIASLALVGLDPICAAKRKASSSEKLLACHLNFST